MKALLKLGCMWFQVHGIERTPSMSELNEILVGQVFGYITTYFVISSEEFYLSASFVYGTCTC